MPFPEVKRVVYKKNPINQVVCQLRFPAILKIDSELPSSFQEMIKKEFPIYTEKMECQLQFSIPPKDIQPPMLSTKNYEFKSEDDLWKINLTRNFLALSTSKYNRWEEFKERMKKPYNALKEIYSPPYFNRIGLRYIDVFNRSQLGLNERNWSDLIKPYMLGLVSSPIKLNLSNFQSIAEVPLSDGVSNVRIFTSFVQQIDTTELCFMADSDFYSIGKISPDTAIEKLDFLNSRASRLIQWIITPELHKAMEPEQI